MAEKDIRAKKILSVVKPILASVRKLSGKDVPWGAGGLPPEDRIDALLAEGDGDLGRQLRAYYSALSALRNQASDRIKWGKGDIPELEYMDSTLAGLYSFVSEYVLGYESGPSETE
jgi:hypothetical protein